MQMQYSVAVFILILSIGMSIYGSRQWGKKMNGIQRMAFITFLAAKDIRLMLVGCDRTNYMLHLIKTHKEIMELNIDFNNLKRKFESRSVLELVDVFDDAIGNRYIKIKTDKYGYIIFELKQYLKVALNQKICDKIREHAPEGACVETVEVLKKRTVLKLIK